MLKCDDVTTLNGYALFGNRKLRGASVLFAGFARKSDNFSSPNQELNGTTAFGRCVRISGGKNKCVFVGILAGRQTPPAPPTAVVYKIHSATVVETRPGDINSLPNSKLTSAELSSFKTGVRTFMRTYDSEATSTSSQQRRAKAAADAAEAAAKEKEEPNKQEAENENRRQMIQKKADAAKKKEQQALIMKAKLDEKEREKKAAAAAVKQAAAKAKAAREAKQAKARKDAAQLAEATMKRCAEKRKNDEASGGENSPGKTQRLESAVKLLTKQNEELSKVVMQLMNNQQQEQGQQAQAKEAQWQGPPESQHHCHQKPAALWPARGKNIQQGRPSNEAPH